MMVIENLTVSVAGAPEKRPILDNISLTVNEGEVLALVGESGSGKSMTALSTLSLLPKGLDRKVKTLTVDGVDLTTKKESTLNHIRGGLVGMLFQQPKRMLDPTTKIGKQVAEPLRLHLGMSRDQARKRVLELLMDVGMDEPARIADSYPHQLSGGLAQRVMIATALSTHPKLLIADEPTTALDASIEAQVLALIKQKQRELGMSALFISHDLHVVKSVSERIAVIFRGQLMEVGSTEQIMERPVHPYTDSLIRCATLVIGKNGRLYEVEETDTASFSLDRGLLTPAQQVGGEYKLVELENDPGHFVRTWVPARAAAA